MSYYIDVALFLAMIACILNFLTLFKSLKIRKIENLARHNVAPQSTQKPWYKHRLITQSVGSLIGTLGILLLCTAESKLLPSTIINNPISITVTLLLLFGGMTTLIYALKLEPHGSQQRQSL